MGLSDKERASNLWKSLFESSMQEYPVAIRKIRTWNQIKISCDCDSPEVATHSQIQWWIQIQLALLI